MMNNELSTLIHQPGSYNLLRQTGTLNSTPP